MPDDNWGAIAIGVITVALIASVESLLSAVSVDRMHSGPRTDFNRELIGQGAANIASGAIGGLPVTGVIVRSSTNVTAGAKSQASAIMHGVWILLFTIPFAGLVDEIPTAALAGLLIVIGVQLLKPAHIETALKHRDLAVYVITALSVIFLNLLQGVMIGLALAIALTGWRVIRARVEARPVEDEWRVVIVGAACTFLALPRLTRVLASIPAGHEVTVNFGSPTSITLRTKRLRIGSDSTRPRVGPFGSTVSSRRARAASTVGPCAASSTPNGPKPPSRPPLSVRKNFARISPRSGKRCAPGWCCRSTGLDYCSARHRARRA